MNRPSLLALAGLAELVFQRCLAEQRGWIFAALAGIFLSMPFAPPWDAGSRPYAVTMPIVFLLCGLGVAAFFELCKIAAKACAISPTEPEARAHPQTNATPLLAAAVVIMLLTCTPGIFPKKTTMENAGCLSRPGGVFHVGGSGNHALSKTEFLARLSVLGMNYPDLQGAFRDTQDNFALMVDWNGPRFRVVDFSNALTNEPGKEIHSVFFDRSVLAGPTGD